MTPPMVRAPVKSFPIKTQVAVSGDGPVPGHACISGPALPRRGSCESGEMGFLSQQDQSCLNEAVALLAGSMHNPHSLTDPTEQGQSPGRPRVSSWRGALKPSSLPTTLVFA